MSFLRQIALAIVFSALGLPVYSQDLISNSTSSSNPSGVPRLVKFSGTLPRASTSGDAVECTFSIYSSQFGDTALWGETQKIDPENSGKFSILLGSATMGGLPDTIFATGQ